MYAYFSLDLSHPLAPPLLTYLRSLPFVTVEKIDGQPFEEAYAESNASSVDDFFDELDERIKRRFNTQTDHTP